MITREKTMNRIITLPVSLLALAVTSTAHAQEEEIYEMITTAIHVRRSETALPVTVLNDKALHDAVRSTLGDTLAGQPGINNASFGPAVGQTVIRGQQGRRVMNLSNGMPNADASGNSADHAQTVEAMLANAIEVLRGPSTLLYGGGAIGGVVNVIDRRIATSLPDAPSFAFEARHDTAADLGTLVGSADFATGNLVWHFDAVRREWNDLEVPGLAIDPAYLEEEHEGENHEGEEDHADEASENTLGYVANTGGETETGTAGVSWILENGYLGFAVNHLDNSYGLPPGAHGHGEEHEGEDGGEEDHAEEPGADFVSIDMERTRYDLNGEWHDLASWAETVSYRLSHTDYEHAEIEGNGALGTQFSNDAWQQRLQVTHTDNAERHGVVGLQLGSEEFAAVGEESFIPVTDIDTQGLFVVEDFHVSAVTIELGARINRDEYAPQASPAPGRSFSTWSLSGSGLWDINDSVTLGLSLSNSQRAPSAEELYSNFGLADLDDCVLHFATGACEIGDTGFDEETSLNTDLTLAVDRGIFSGTVTLFHNTFDDYIGQFADGREVDGFPVRAYRQEDARFSGIEVDASLQLHASATLRLFGDAVRGRFDTSGDVPRMPPKRIGLELLLDGELAGNTWSAYTTLIHAEAQADAGAFEIESASWSRLDVGADYTMNTGRGGEWLVFIRGRNLGDKDIRLSTSYLRGFAPEAGRSVEVGVRYRY
jgi:iron complex outermembrane receptor protein